MFAPDELIAALSDGGVEYVLIGGLAVGAHGFPRATKDVDVVPAPDAGNLDRLTKVLRAIEAHNFGAGDFDPPSSGSTRIFSISRSSASPDAPATSSRNERLVPWPCRRTSAILGLAPCPTVSE
jgi:hypothetical protein